MGLFLLLVKEKVVESCLDALSRKKLRIIFSSISTYIVPRPFCELFDLCLQPYFLDGIQASISIMILENL